VSLADLDALVLTVRDIKSREYLKESIAAYRAGAFKAAVNSTWIAVAYDILIKIRELSFAGDASAITFLNVFDGAVQNSNVEQLLRMESQLLDKAAKDFFFLSESEYELLTRLKADRNNCSHPSFTSETELFRPSAELVRMHIVHAVEFLLSKAPVQGKTLITQFELDLASNAFPGDRERIVSYVRARYLERAKPAVVRNLGIIVAKALLRQDYAPWVGNENRLLASLESIENFDQNLFRESLRPSIVQVIDSLDASKLANVFPVLSRFPALIGDLGAAIDMRLSALIDNFDPVLDVGNVIFAAASLPMFEARVVAALRRTTDDRLLEVIEEFPLRPFVPIAIEHLANSGGWRTAERRFRRGIFPLGELITRADVGPLVRAVVENGQIWDAGGIPPLLHEFISLFNQDGRLDDPNAWQPLANRIVEYELQNRYESLSEFLHFDVPN